MAKKTKQEAQQERLSLAEKRNRQERRNKKSRKEREQEKRRKKQERDRRKQKNIPTTAQQSIPYIRMLQDGICQVTKNFFSKTIQFYDINYQLALNEDKPVGFLMIGFDVDDYWTDAPEIAKGNYNLWRLMIDKAYQNRGYGKEAVSLALEFIKSMPCGEAEYCWLSYEPDNAVARQMYRSFGFEETGEMDGEELIAVLRLQLTTSSF